MGDMNGDGIPDLVLATINTNLAVHFGNGDGTFQAAKTNNLVSGASYDVAVADFNGDGALDAVTGLSNKIALAKTEKVSDIGRLYLLSQEGAREALEISRRTLERITMELGVIGGLQSRLQSAANVLTERRLAQTAAESAIRDADIASESAKVIRHGIIQQAAAAVLSQANQQPALAIQLLRI
jgi:flagellin